MHKALSKADLNVLAMLSNSVHWSELCGECSFSELVSIPELAALLFGVGHESTLSAALLRQVAPCTAQDSPTSTQGNKPVVTCNKVDRLHAD